MTYEERLAKIREVASVIVDFGRMRGLDAAATRGSAHEAGEQVAAESIFDV